MCNDSVTDIPLDKIIGNWSSICDLPEDWLVINVVRFFFVWYSFANPRPLTSRGVHSHKTVYSTYKRLYLNCFLNKPFLTGCRDLKSLYA